MLFRQLLDADTWTYTYLLADEDGGEAILIDPVWEQHQRDAALIRELGLSLRYTLETHVHADHVTGGWSMREAVGSKICVLKTAGVDGADVDLKHGDTVRAGTLSLTVRATPGHTSGCATYVLEDQSIAFTGDALLIRGAGRTDFQQGSAHTLFHSVREQIFTLPGTCTLYPGHDYNGRTSTTVLEERRHNPRLGDGVREEDFVGFMNNLGLPHPTRLDVAVPANLRCGRPTEGSELPVALDWGPVVRTFAGFNQIDPEWAHSRLADLTLIDVREADEVAATGKRIAGSTVIPLSSLRDRIAEIPRDKPVIAICPAGARSAHAAQLLEKAGIERVANLAGGLLRWRALGFPLV